ncbi:MAG: hypothetical protein HFJ09_07450 [Lachnospiraceae bacterium]|nr:hypothetical protein [Lachnospiraceae bacterium]
MKQEIQIADKSTLDKVKELLENSGYGLEALKTLIGSSGSGGGRYKPVQSLAVSNSQTLQFYGKGKIRVFTNAHGSSAISITSLDVDGLSNHMANLAAQFNNSIEIEFDNHCFITLNCNSYFCFVYHYQYVTS